MATILAQVPLTATADVLLVASAQGRGPAGWRLGFLGASWVGSVVLKANMAAPGQAQSLTSIAFITESTGATNAADTPITATGAFIIQPDNCAYDLYAVYTHTSGSAVVTVQAQDGATASGDLTAANLDGSGSQNTFGAAVPYTGAYTFPGALAITGALTGVTQATFSTKIVSSTALATPSALAATAFNAFASTVSGAVLMGYGTTGDVTLKNRAGTSVAYVGPNTTAFTFVGTVTVGDDLSVAKTISSTTPSTERLTLSEITLSGTTIAIGSGGSIAGVRGAITVQAGKTFTEGFLYGTQGKVTLAGTMNEGSAARIAGVLGQVDLSTGTLTDGQVSAIWGDLQGNPTLTDPSQLNLIRATNSTTAGVANAVVFAYGKASYFAHLGADGGAGNVAYWGAAAPSSLAKSLKILGPDGTAYYIGLYSAAS